MAAESKILISWSGPDQVDQGGPKQLEQAPACYELLSSHMNRKASLSNRWVFLVG